MFPDQPVKNAEWKKIKISLHSKVFGGFCQDTKEMLDYYGGFGLPCVWTVEISVQCVDMWFEVLRIFIFLFLLLAFTCLELHKVNVTGMRGSVNVFVLVCVLLQGAKLLQMSICRVHNPPEPTRICTSAPLTLPQTHAIVFAFPQAHAEKLPQNLKHSADTCTGCAVPVLALFRLFFILTAICIKKHPTFSQAVTLM